MDNETNTNVPESEPLAVTQTEEIPAPEEVAEEEMTRIINAAIVRRKNMLVKYASTIKKLKTDFKMGKLLVKYAGKVDLLAQLNLEALDGGEDKGEGEVK